MAKLYILIVISNLRKIDYLGSRKLERTGVRQKILKERERETSRTRHHLGEQTAGEHGTRYRR